MDAWSAGRMACARSTGDEGAAARRPARRKRRRMLPFARGGVGVGARGIGGVLEVADESLGAGVGGGVLHGDPQALHGRANPARGTAEEECGDVE